MKPRSQHPLHRVLQPPAHGRLVPQALVLPEVVDAQDGHHPQPVQGPQDRLQAPQVAPLQLALGVQGAVVPRLGVLQGPLQLGPGGLPGLWREGGQDLVQALGAEVARGAAPLQVEGHRQQAVGPVAGEHGHELGAVARGVPAPRIGVGPHGGGEGVLVVEGGLHHAGVHQQALHGVPPPGAPGVRGASVEQEALPFDGDLGLAHGCPLPPCPFPCPRGGRPLVLPADERIRCGP